MLKPIHTGLGLPIGFPVDPTSEFEPGMFGQLTVSGQDLTMGVSDGTAPFGILIDARTSSFSRPAVDEIVIVPAGATEINPDGKKVNSFDVKEDLESPSIFENSFTSTISVILNPINGNITVPAGTELNHDADGDGLDDSFRVIVNYMYRIANKPGDDTTLGSGRVSLYYHRGIYATDQFDTLANYPVNATLYVGLDGKLTTNQPTDAHPGIAMVVGPPSATDGMLQFELF